MGKVEGAPWRKKHGNSLRKASWRRGTGRDGRGGWEIGWEKWKERTGGRSVAIACKSMGGGGSSMEDKRWGKRCTGGRSVEIAGKSMGGGGSGMEDN